MNTEQPVPALAAFHLRAAAIYAVIGMAFGIHMGIAQDFSLMPAHAHLNVIGWLSIAVYGLVLAKFPAAAASRLAKLQAIAAHLGLIVFVPGVAVAILSNHEMEIFAIIGSLLVLLGALLFVPLVWSATGRRR
ncbi:MAG TPA: hypothetical protein VM639_00505 [Dongiaceae bacterium]|nr:hypothetical protein [Dongiaceae bacterium]